LDNMCKVTLWWEDTQWWCAVRYPHSPSRNVVIAAPDVGGVPSLVALTDWALSLVPRPLQALASIDVVSPMGVPMSLDWIQPASLRALRRSKKLTALRTPWPPLKRRRRRPPPRQRQDEHSVRLRLSLP